MRASYNFWDYVAWNRNMLERNLNTLHFQYQDYMGNAGTLQQLVNKLHSFGLAFIDAVPPTETAIRGLAERIGPLKHTFYGETWDVKSTPSPINVAYTADDLDFHMDLLYMVDPPYVQLLHCIKQSTQGGESRFADGVRAFERLQTEHPELVQPLVEFPITYYYKNNGHWFQKTRRFIEGGSQIQSRSKPEARRRYEYPKDYETINWSPPFQGPLEQVDPTNRSGNAISVGRYVEAANAFKRLLCEESAVFETKLEEGTCVVFNNRRVLHARRPFSNEGGERWLKGCYVDGDYLRDRFRVFAEAGSEGKT
ncbi:MAG: hypothetical protein LQ340_000411 [Diploschistes diacapsis]|nr:MAG: hypothetical protein LQ340_000411 [Diploschistes diacapsis]